MRSMWQYVREFQVLETHIGEPHVIAPAAKHESEPLWMVDDGKPSKAPPRLHLDVNDVARRLQVSSSREAILEISRFYTCCKT